MNNIEANTALAHPTSTRNHWQNSESQTGVKLDKLRHIWTIKNFSFCEKDTGEFLESSAFSVAGGPECVLRLYPNGWSQDCAGYISLYLVINVNGNGERYPTVKYKFSMKNVQESINRSRKEFYWKIAGPQMMHGYPKFMNRVELIKLLKDDQLIICCEVTIPGAKICTSRSNNIEVPESTLSDDLGSMFGNQKFGNSVIQVDDKEFVVCRQILQARSPVFAAMFEHDMEEQNQNRIIIKDFKANVVEEMLTYIYTDRSPKLEDMADDLLLIADKYDLRRLKIMSEDMLSRKLTLKNAIEILILADLCGANMLKTCVINFIVENGSYFLESSVWGNTISSLSKYQNLIVEMTRALCASNDK